MSWGNMILVISIHALRVEGDKQIKQTAIGKPKISIHALRVEGDSATSKMYRASIDFYPRPPGGGRQQKSVGFAKVLFLFLSTPSGWRATDYTLQACFVERISIHALRVEGDFVLSIM